MSDEVLGHAVIGRPEYLEAVLLRSLWIHDGNFIPRRPKSINEVKAFDQNWERNHQVAKRKWPNRVIVSTVFLCHDHRWFEPGPPIVFETMIFGGPHDEYQARYCTIEEAREGHAFAVFLAELTLPPPIALPPGPRRSWWGRMLSFFRRGVA